jgi:AraC-like DNA-binding protein
MLNIYDFVSDSNLFKKFAVDDFLFVEYKCLFPDNQVSCWTTCNYFVYVLGGRKKWIVDNEEFIVHDGEGLFVRKGAYIAQKFFDEDFCALLIFVPDDFIRAVVKKYTALYAGRPRLRADGSIIKLNIDQTLSAYFHSVLSFFPKEDSPPKELLTIKFEELILQVLTSPQNNELTAHFFAIQDEAGKLSVREVMERYFMYNMGVDEYARLCARSLSTFKADFFELYGTSPGKWLTSKRLEYAKHLIETTDEPISEVAIKSGFKNTSHFVRIFKVRYGKPPLQHRNVLMA